MSALVTARFSRPACLRLAPGHGGRRSRLGPLHRCNLSPHSRPQTVSNFVGITHLHDAVRDSVEAPVHRGLSCSPQSGYAYRPTAAATACHNALGAGIMP